jgi:P-type Cu+ transporter
MRYVCGIIALADTIKEYAKETIDALKEEMGIEVIMLTGDNERTAHAISSKLGIKSYSASITSTKRTSSFKDKGTRA